MNKLRHWLSHLSVNTLYNGVALSSFIFSLGGVAITIIFKLDPTNGGRGGAIAVAISFAALFIGNNLGITIGQILLSPPEGTPFTVKDIEEAANVSAKVDRANQTLQRNALTFASCVGTIYWGFGDILAKNFESYLGYLKI